MKSSRKTSQEFSPRNPPNTVERAFSCKEQISDASSGFNLAGNKSYKKKQLLETTNQKG
jgi:hypothetical protein